MAPKGWHVPSYNEFLVLRKFIGLKEGGKKMKSISDWDTKVPSFPLGNNGTNSSGFDGLPGGHRDWWPSNYEVPSNFGALHYSAGFWTSTTNYNKYTKDLYAKFFCLYLMTDVLDESHCEKGQGRSIRCIKD